MDSKRARWIGFIVGGLILAFGTWTAAGALTGGAAQATYGPVLDEFGPVYFSGEVDFGTPLDRDFRALFDVS